MKRNCSFTDRVLHLSLLNTYTKGLFDSFIRTPWLVSLVYWQHLAVITVYTPQGLKIILVFLKLAG